MINTVFLKEWIIEYNIEKIAVEYYWEYLKMYMKEVDDEYSNILKYIDLRFMKVNLYKVSLSTLLENQSELINVYLDITYADKSMGTFEIVYTLSAEYLDEYLKFDDINYMWRLGAVYEKILEIGKIALEEGANEEFVSKITGLSIDKFKDVIN